MTDLAHSEAAGGRPLWLFVPAAAGLAWNLYGLVQLAGSFRQTAETLMAGGMTAAQAEICLSLPVWITAAFVAGVLGGVAGSILLLLRRAASVPVFALSLAGYILLFAGDVSYGVFAAIPQQLAILAAVVVIAGGLLALSLLARKRAMLR